MENNTSRWLLVSMIMACSAATKASPMPENSAQQNLNRFGLNYRAGFNISAKFKNIGGFNSPNNAGPATPGVDHFYDDGYNRVDVLNNAGNMTTFWGYDNASQVQGNTIVMNTTSAAGKLSSKDRSDDPQHGAELTYHRQLGTMGKVKWGVEGGLGYTSVDLRDRGTSFANAMRISDAYTIPPSFPAVIVPPPGYRGNDGSSPGTQPVLGDIPARTTTLIPNGAAITGSRRFEADIYGLRVGPYFEVPLSERFSVLLSGGLSLLSVNSDFKYSETVSVPGGTAQTRKGDGSHSDLLVGGYVGGNVLFALNETVNLSAGVQFQSNGTYSHKENGKEAELDLGQTVFLSLGVGFSF